MATHLERQAIKTLRTQEYQDRIYRSQINKREEQKILDQLQMEYSTKIKELQFYRQQRRTPILNDIVKSFKDNNCQIIDAKVTYDPSDMIGIDTSMGDDRIEISFIFNTINYIFSMAFKQTKINIYVAIRPRNDSFKFNASYFVNYFDSNESLSIYIKHLLGIL